MPDDLQARKRQEYQRYIGKPARVLPHEFEEVKAKIVDWHARGLSYRQIGWIVGIVESRIDRIVTGHSVTVLRKSYDKIMAAEFGTAPGRGVIVSPLPARRKLQALAAKGFSWEFLGNQCGRAESNLRKIASGRSTIIHWELDRDVAAMYDALADSDPITDHGFDPVSAGRSKKWAINRNGYAPPWCWDEDTIDDPKAFPEWTGKCGKFAGYLIHRRENTTPCKRCEVTTERVPIDIELMIKLFDSGDVSRKEIAERVGAHDTVIAGYAQSYLGPDLTQHLLMNLSRVGMRAFCTFCKCDVDVFTSGKTSARNTRFQCSNKVKEYRRSREEQGIYRH